MRILRRRAVSAVILLATLTMPRAKIQADEAVLPDGRRLQGTLAVDDAGRLRFTVAKPATTLSLDRIQYVRFPVVAATPLRAGTIHQVHLHGGQTLTGELLGLDERQLRLRTAWSASVVIPRHALVAVTQPAGFVTFFDEDFEGNLKVWKRTGEPSFSEQRTSGQRGLLLSAVGQSAEYTLATPLEEGRIGVNFLEEGAATGAFWLVEAEFRGDAEPRRVRVILAGEGDAYHVTVPDAKSNLPRVARTAGWHRLEVGFTKGSLRVTLDEAGLWFNPRQGPAGPLRQVRLACVAADGAGERRGQIVFDDFSLSKVVEKAHRPPGDLSQDELWLLSGDQFFGSIAAADRRTLTLRDRSGPGSFAWAEVRGLFPRRETVPPRTTEGEHVRVGVRSGAGSEVDQLEGVLRAFDKDGLTLQHPLLGKLTIERSRLHQLRWLFDGRRIEVDNGFHHLGPKDKMVPALQPPRAEGLSLRRTFALDAVPREARLAVYVVQLKGPSDGLAKALERGEALTEVVVNGRRVDYLNRYVDRPVTEERLLRVPLPADALRTGENVIELRQTPDRKSERYDSCGVSGLAVEIPR